MKKFKILFAFLISSLFISNAYSASIDNIQAIDYKNVKVMASEDIIFSDTKVYWEVKVLEDISILNVSRDYSNKRKLILTLKESLIKNTNYSLIWVIWAEWSIDFSLEDKFNVQKINENLYNEEKIIEKIIVKDSKTIEVYYNYDLKDWNYEFKLLSDIIVNSVTSKWNNVLDINLEWALEKSSSYIFMILSLENIDWKELSFKESLYNFTTNSNLIIDDSVKQDIIDNEEIKTNLEEIALNAPQTPHTWAETWFLLLLTFMSSILFLFRKKI